MTRLGGKGYNSKVTKTQGKMKDDERYQKVMGAYKMARRDPKKRQEADKLLKEAFRLEKEGEVSPEVVEGMAYI